MTYSISDKVYPALFAEHGIDGTFEKIPLKKSLLGLFFRSNLSYDFITVTMPHKKAVMEYCTSLTEEARAIGSVNYILLSEGELLGCNFDGIGALDPIEQIIPVSGKRILVLGAGGAARAAIFEAKKRGAEVFVWNRTKDRAQLLAKEFGVHFTAEISPDFEVLINATSVGMASDDRGVLIKEPRFLHKKVVLDMASRDGNCPLAKATLDNSGTYISGKEMFTTLTLAGLHFLQNTGPLVEKS